MERNIKLIINKVYKENNNYFNNEEYSDFLKEFEYSNENLYSINFHSIYMAIINILNKYKLFFIIFIIILIHIYYT